MTRVLPMRSPGVFRTSKTPLRRRFLLVRRIFLPARVSLSLTVSVPPGGTLAVPKANWTLRGAFAAGSALDVSERRGTNAKRSMGLGTRYPLLLSELAGDEGLAAGCFAGYGSLWRG